MIDPTAVTAGPRLKGTYHLHLTRETIKFKLQKQKQRSPSELSVVFQLKKESHAGTFVQYPSCLY
jgi:hypothetical protein